MQFGKEKVELDGDKICINESVQILKELDLPILFQSGNYKIFQENPISEHP